MSGILKKVIENKRCDGMENEKYGFCNGMACVDQVFAVKHAMKKYCEKK